MVAHSTMSSYDIEGPLWILTLTKKVRDTVLRHAFVVIFAVFLGNYVTFLPNESKTRFYTSKSNGHSEYNVFI